MALSLYVVGDEGQGTGVQGETALHSGGVLRWEMHLNASQRTKRCCPARAPAAGLASCSAARKGGVLAKKGGDAHQRKAVPLPAAGRGPAGPAQRLCRRS